MPLDNPAGMLNDLRYASRVLLQAKGWTAVVVLSLAMGIGASTALFSAVDEFLKDSTVWFNEPLQVPKGARIVSTAWYDNSSANRSNPDPKVDVTWGHQTWEEMQYTGILLSAAQ